jgi:hypothetical protein
LNRYSIQNYASIRRRRDKGIFLAEPSQRLDRIGFVLDAHESRWEKGFAALERFKAHKGHCRVPWSDIEGKFRLGQWVALQRKAKDKMLQTEENLAVVARAFAESETHSRHATTRTLPSTWRHEHIAQL